MSVTIDIPLIDSFGNNITIEGCLTNSNSRHTNSVVIFAHGSGSSKDSPRNQYLSKKLNENGIATFLFDLLTQKEQESDEKVEKIQQQVPGLTLNKFNISLLSDRLIKVTNYLLHQQISQLQDRKMNIGYFGASTGVAASLYASGKLNEANSSISIKAIVSRGGRPDLLSSFLLSNHNNFNKDIIENIKKIPTLFIIGQKDKLVLDWTKKFIKNYKLIDKFNIDIVKDASHLFKEKDALEKVGEIAVRWFIQHL